MKFIELQAYDNYSVILRQDDKGNPLHISPFVVAGMPNKKDGEIIDWAFGHYFEDLFNAVDFARAKQKGRINFYRLEEIASKVIDGFVEHNADSAYEYFASEVEMDNHEADYFGLDTKVLSEYK